jgi:hypothetical protein
MPITVLGPGVGWALLHWQDLHDFIYLSSMGKTGNLKPPSTPVTPGLSRLPAVGLASAALACGVLLLAVLALITLIRHRRDQRTWAFAMCPAVGIAIIMVNPYGNEGIFRAALFGIPWLAILAAQAFRGAGTPRRSTAAVLAALLPLSAAYAISAFGLDATNVLRPDDRIAYQAFRAANPHSDEPTYLLALGPGDVPDMPPSQNLLHVAVKRLTIDPHGFALTGAPAPQVVEELTAALIDYAAMTAPAGHLYAIWSPVSEYYGWEYGIHTREQFTALRDAFAASTSWKTTYSRNGSRLFEYIGPPDESAGH